MLSNKSVDSLIVARIDPCFACDIERFLMEIRCSRGFEVKTWCLSVLGL